MHREAVARGQLGVDGGRVDARVAKVLLDLAQRDALPDLIDGRAVPKVPSGGGSHCTVAANHLDPSGDRVTTDEPPTVAVGHRLTPTLARAEEVVRICNVRVVDQGPQGGDEVGT